MAESVTLEDLSYQAAGAPIEVSASGLDPIHDAGLDTNGVTREIVIIRANNSATVERTVSVAIGGSTIHAVIKLRPQAGWVEILPQTIIPPSTSGSTMQISAEADGADVFVSGVVQQFKDTEL